MTDRRLKRAVVLAAGLGSRLAGQTGLTPKPLRKVAGVPLLVRILRNLQEVGIREAVVVLGHEGQQIRERLVAEPSLALELSFVDNARYRAKNGVSLIAAGAFIDRECLLVMADHLYSPELPRRLMSVELPEGACALGVDRDIERCFDLDDATKVATVDGRIARIGKELPDYDSLDTGVFRIGPALIDALRVVDARQGDCSLSDGVAALAARGAFFAVDVGDARWIDVDTPEALERAEAMLRVFGDHLGDEPEETAAPISPDAIEGFAPTWVRAAQPYREDHFAIADGRQGVDRMMSNESPFAPSPRVVQAIVDAALRGNLYPCSGKGLRRRLGEREGLAEENVILGAGSTELIDLVIRTFVGPGEEVLLSVPTFSMYEARTRLVGGIPTLVPTTAQHDVDVPGLIRAVTERTKVVFLCTPNNPTGNPIAETDLRRIAALGLPTVVDEAYFELGSKRSYAYLLREFPNLVVLRTFSKAHGLAGIRLGYALGHRAVVHLLSRVKLPWNISATTIAAAEATLDDEAEFQSRVQTLQLEREALERQVAAIPGVDVLPSEGNFVLIDISRTPFSAGYLVDRVLEEGVLIRSLEVHHARRHFVRITVGTNSQNERCVSALARVIARGAGSLARPMVAATGDAE
jgi:histidinol-phosphate aminotransferase